MRANKTLVIKYFMFDGTEKNTILCGEWIHTARMHSCNDDEKKTRLLIGWDGNESHCSTIQPKFYGIQSERCSI